MAERFYLNCPLNLGLVALDGPEAHHLATVCRLRPGDAVCLFNGDGSEYLGRVATVQRRFVEIEVLDLQTPPRELPFRLEVAAPLPKGDRAQFLVEKLTELGVTRFVPLLTERSIVVPREAKIEKLERHVIEASKQCGRNVLMEIASLTAWADYCQAPNLPAARRIAHPSAQGMICNSFDAVPIALGVGPEGGFTDAEVALGQQAGWRLLSLGPRILRVETAAIALAARAAAGFAEPQA